VSLPDLEVDGVVGGRHLERPGPELAVHGLVGDHGDPSVQKGQDDRSSDEVSVALVVGVDGHGGVAQHRLRAGRGNDEEFIGALQRVLDVVKLALRLLIDDLEVGEGGAAAGAPVDEPLAPIN